jgi:serpin B
MKRFVMTCVSGCVRQVVPLIAVSMLIAGCGHNDSNKQQDGAARSSLKREPAPEVSGEQLATLANGNRAFALDMYAELVRKHPDDSLFFSPFSISIALAMTYAGAAGTTAEAMASTLHFELEEPTLHAAFNSVDLALASRGQGAHGTDDEPFRLHVTNSIWGQKGVAFRGPFLDTLAVNYGAWLRLVDFTAEPEESRKLINAWVEAETEERIKELLPADSIHRDTLMVLVNAIYFNAAWGSQFRKEATQPDDFTTLSGAVVSVPMMSAVDRVGYYAAEGVHAIEKVYDGNELSMVLVVPDGGALASFEAGLNSDVLRAILDGLQVKRGQLRMPKWQYDGQSIALKELLTALGMGVAFNAGADFSRLSAETTSIADVYHQAFIAVDENGTEAAAATAVVLGGRGAPPPMDFELTVDRPFIYLIRDRATDTIVFMGRVTDPSR